MAYVVDSASYRGNEDFARPKCLQRTQKPLRKSFSARFYQERGVICATPIQIDPELTDKTRRKKVRISF